ncbi:MAG: two-component regulator propeller domain-containing protein [Candidatus Zixiibacteriota bacterium]
MNTQRNCQQQLEQSPSRSRITRKAALLGFLTLITASSVCRSQWPRPEMYQADFLTIGSYADITAVTATNYFAYFASRAGVLRYDILKGRWAEPIDFFGGFAGSVVYRLAASFDDERLWAETDLGAFLYERLFGYWTAVNEFPAYEIAGEFVRPEVVHTAPDGFTYFPDGNLLDRWGRQFTTDPIFRDRNGYLWMGVRGYGPARSEIDGGRLSFLPFGVLQIWVSALTIVDGRLIIGGVVDGSPRIGLTLLDRATEEFEYIEQGLELNFPQIDVRSLGRSENSILVGTDLGLFEINRLTREVSGYDRFSGLPHTRVNAAVGIGDTSLIGTQSGLAILFPDSSGVKEVARQALAFTAIYCLEPAWPRPRRNLQLGSNLRPRHVWMGAESGAYRIDMETFKLKRLNDPEGVLNSAVRQIRLVGSNLWLLAENGLVRVGLQSGEVESYPEINRYGGHTALAVNGQLVAIGTEFGLALFDYQRKGRITHRFTLNDGLPSNKVTSLLFDGDYLWVGTDRGLSRFWWSNPSRVY